MADDAVMVDFLAALDDYVPAIPDELVEHCLAAGGFQSQDARLTRLVAAATQKFVADVATDALQYCKLRQKSGPGKERLVLTSDDLAAALREFGINVKRHECFADSAAAGTVQAPPPPPPPPPQSELQQLAQP